MADKQEELLLTDEEIKPFIKEITILGLESITSRIEYDIPKLLQSQLAKLLKAGYVKLAKDQSFEADERWKDNYACIFTQQDMLKAGWRKVELEANNG